MNTLQQRNRANAQHSTGPRTSAGKERVSRNAETHGLFSSSTYVAPGDEETYRQLRSALLVELRPEGVVEQLHAETAITAAWRLRRCALLESSLQPADGLDPMADPATAKLQASIDRARNQALSQFRRAQSDLRKLQAEGRPVPSSSIPTPSVEAPAPEPVSQPETKLTQPIARSAPCPCGSQLRYKRCCGHNAPPMPLRPRPDIRPTAQQ